MSKSMWMSGSGSIGRRDLLRGIGAGVAFLAPFARSIEAEAQSGSKPGKGNFVFYYTPNGFARDQFGSDGNDGSFAFRRGMRNAEPMKEHISTIRGLSQKAQHTQAPFHDQLTRLLTCVSGPQVGTGFGPSIDQHIAKTLADQTALNTIVYWPGITNSGTYVYLSWRGPGLSARNIFESKDAYAQVFGAAMPTGNTAELMGEIERKKSLIDFLRNDVSLFKSRLSKRDKSRLDQQLEALRAVEKKIAGPGGGGAAACDLTAVARAKDFVSPRTGGGPGMYSRPDFERHADMHEDIIVTALACGLRVSATIMHQAAASGLNPLGGQGKADDHHWVSHGDGGRDTWVAIDNYYSGRYANFLKKLQTVGILDKTVVAWGSEIAESHSHNNCVFVVGGGKALGIKHKKSISFPFVGGEGGGRNAARNPANRAISDLWVSVQNAVGIPSDKFGDDSTGGIKELWSGA